MNDLPHRHRQPWARSEDERLLKAVRRRDESFCVIVEKHQRTSEGIRQRLVKLADKGGITGIEYTSGYDLLMRKIQEQPNGFTDRVLNKIYGCDNPLFNNIAPRCDTQTKRKEKKAVQAKFYNVASSGPAPVDVRPVTKMEAIERAKALARLYPTSTVFVMEAIESYSMGNPLRRALKAEPKPRVKKAV
jgi:hypothetical protein